MDSDRVVKLISKIIEKRYCDFRDDSEVPFDDLLDWELWPGIFKIYCKQMHTSFQHFYINTIK